LFFFGKYIIESMLLLLSSTAYSAGSISIISGNKTLDWQQIESQPESGYGLEFMAREWSSSLVITHLNSEDSAILEGFGGNIRATGKTTETGIGMRSYLTQNNIRFFAEGGLAVISASIRLERGSELLSDSNTTIGFWFGAGVDVMLGDILSIGFLGRVSNAPMTLGGVDSNAGGTHFNIFATFHFGR